MATCRHCCEQLPSTFDICWNCGVPTTGPYEAPDSPTAVAKKLEPSSGDSTPASRFETTPPRPGVRFGTRHLLILTAIAALLLACGQSKHAVFLITAVVITNLFGVLAAIFVTTIWGLPNDGSLQKFPSEVEAKQDDETDEVA